MYYITLYSSILCIFDCSVLNLNYKVSFINHNYAIVPTTTIPTANTNATAAIVPTNTTTTCNYSWKGASTATWRLTRTGASSRERTSYSTAV